MSAPPEIASPHCAECGAAYRLAGDRCWLCGAKLPHAKPAEVPRASSPADFVEATLVQRETASTFSLSSIFLVMTLAAIAVGVFAAAPGLGILFAVIAAPALLRVMALTATGALVWLLVRSLFFPRNVG